MYEKILGKEKNYRKSKTAKNLKQAKKKKKKPVKM